MKETFNKKESD